MVCGLVDSMFDIIFRQFTKCCYIIFNTFTSSLGIALMIAALLEMVCGFPQSLWQYEYVGVVT
jgi:hypothetical protein